MSKIFKVGDLVKLRNPTDKNHNLGVVTKISPENAHIVSHGKTVVVQVYWPKLGVTDWEYDFFLLKLEDPDLTKKKK